MLIIAIQNQVGATGVVMKVHGAKNLANIIILLSSIGVFVFLSPACASTENINNPPPLILSGKENPKLDSQLNQLIQAEAQGEAISFAEQSNIELLSGRVRVIIECLPGQLEEAKEAATSVGANIETSYKDLLQAVVPISSLTTLAEATSVKFIRLPQTPLPGAG